MTWEGKDVDDLREILPEIQTQAITVFHCLDSLVKFSIWNPDTPSRDELNQIEHGQKKSTLKIATILADFSICRFPFKHLKT
jgi:hypothetical protein